MKCWVNLQLNGIDFEGGIQAVIFKITNKKITLILFRLCLNLIFSDGGDQIQIVLYYLINFSTYR